MDRQKVVAVDFDGVINNYRGWKGLGQFEGLVPGCVEELQKLRDAGWYIIIFTTRGEDVDEVLMFLEKNKVPYDSYNENHPNAPDNLSDQKVIADVYIDDRAINFSGRWAGMAERVQQFQPWYRTSGLRPGFGMELMGYQADQLALVVPMGRAAPTISGWKHLGVSDWVHDHVVAKAWCDTGSEMVFGVNLSFNYSIFGFEFEVLEPDGLGPYPPHIAKLLNSQRQPQLDIQLPTLSHIGFHVPDFAEAVSKFRRDRFTVYAEIETIEHSSCPHRYRYAFVDTYELLGFDAKLICRIPESF